MSNFPAALYEKFMRERFPDQVLEWELFESGLSLRAYITRYYPEADAAYKRWARAIFSTEAG